MIIIVMTVIVISRLSSRKDAKSCRKLMVQRLNVRFRLASSHVAEGCLALGFDHPSGVIGITVLAMIFKGE